MDSWVNSCLGDFPEDDTLEGRRVHEIAKAHITDMTRVGHIRYVVERSFYHYWSLICFLLLKFTSRIIKAFMRYHLGSDTKWNPAVVSKDTPDRIAQYIFKKCGSIADGGEGKKVMFHFGLFVRPPASPFADGRCSTRQQLQPEPPLLIGTRT